jgi:hypothetical protein
MDSGYEGRDAWIDRQHLDGVCGWRMERSFAPQISAAESAKLLYPITYGQPHLTALFLLFDVIVNI